MIRNSFLFLPKIKFKKEQKIWNQGIKDWEDFLANNVRGISARAKHYYNRQILLAKRALYNGDSNYFIDKLPATQTWRLYDFFRDEAVFLDIEASGSRNNSFLTVIGLFDGYDTKIMVNSYNLNIAALKQEFKKFKLLITYNGSSFDIPFLNKKYPGLLPRIPHFDLRHACNNIGLNGGLKEIELKLGIKRRNKIIEKFYGGDPLKLWRMFKATGDKYYLELLVKYNEEDVINLKHIANHVAAELTNKHHKFLK